MDIIEALEAVKRGHRVTASHFTEGCYVEALPSGSIVKAWPVEVPEDEWQRSQSVFVAGEADEAADWRFSDPSPFDSRGNPLIRPVAIPDSENVETRVRRSRWGKTSEAAQLIAIEQERARYIEGREV